MLSKYDWIPSEQQYFGQPNTAYDFGANEPREVQTKLTKLQERKVIINHSCYLYYSLRLATMGINRFT